MWRWLTAGESHGPGLTILMDGVPAGVPIDEDTIERDLRRRQGGYGRGGRMLIEILNRDYVIADLPTRVWWEGDGCVVLEEVELNYFSSRIQVNRSVVFDDGYTSVWPQSRA